MQFLDNLPKILFFTGKGGVGKTSLACATAVKLAEQGKKVLLVSTDPASNVGQVFAQTIGAKTQAIAAVPNLSALEMDPPEAARAYRERIVGPVRGVLPADVVRGIEEQLSGACTTEIAAFDQFTALLTDEALTSQYAHIIFDTAPTGHTIRLLQLPGAWSGFLESGKGDASCLGPLAGLEKQRAQYKAAVDALADAAQTRMMLVARAQASSLREAARTAGELAAIGLQNQHLIINGLLPERACAGDLLAQAVFAREQAALAAMPAALARLPRDAVPLQAFDMVGVDALRQLLTPSADKHQSKAPQQDHAENAKDAIENIATEASLDKLVNELAANGHGLIMLMGKGGVGKTTMAAAIAVALAEHGLPVHLSTSDPAAHVYETLAGDMAHLSVSRIDPHAETERYRAHVLTTKGAQLDAQGRAMLEEDLRSPCTEEIAVFQAFSRTIRQAGKQFVVMDTAPTGHTLLLLDATGAYHRDIARQMSSSMGDKAHFTTPMMQLQDATHTQVIIVTLAETTPVLEAVRLQDDLRRAGIQPWAWIVNNSVAAAQPSSPLLQVRAANEMKQIQAVATQHSQRYAVVPLQVQEPVGIKRLLALSAPRMATASA